MAHFSASNFEINGFMHTLYIVSSLTLPVQSSHLSAMKKYGQLSQLKYYAVEISAIVVL